MITELSIAASIVLLGGGTFFYIYRKNLPKKGSVAYLIRANRKNKFLVKMTNHGVVDKPPIDIEVVTHLDKELIKMARDHESVRSALLGDNEEESKVVVGTLDSRIDPRRF